MDVGGLVNEAIGPCYRGGGTVAHSHEAVLVTLKRPGWLRCSPTALERAFVESGAAQLTLDLEQSIVFGKPLAARQRARLDLTTVHGNRNIGNK